MNENLTVAMAPLEGITTAIFRKVYRKYYTGVDLFYTPFLSANHTHKFKKREKREYLPFDDTLIPQLITNSPDDFLWAARVLTEVGYKEINLNAGCPSSTVFSKRKGAGMLFDTDELERFFSAVFEVKEKEDLAEVSVKTRIGVHDASEAEDIAKVYSAFPFKEVIIHPRLRVDYYRNDVDLGAFKLMRDIITPPVASTSSATEAPVPELVEGTSVETTRTLIMYNGDICSVDDVKALQKQIPGTDRIMIGRGLLKNPALPQMLKGGEGLKIEELKAFHYDLYAAYKEELVNDRDVLFKMKELWGYWATLFSENDRQLKAIRKTKNPNEYHAAVETIFTTVC